MLFKQDLFSFSFLFLAIISSTVNLDSLQKDFKLLIKQTDFLQLYQDRKKKVSKIMKGPKSQQYEIHALVGRCHLHSKKKNSYAITLKMGSKTVAHTDYKQPENDEIDFNTELILKIDKLLYEGVGKLSIIVSMLNEEKQKKIIGSVFAHFKEKGNQSYRISQCSCKQKGFEVNVKFQVLNLQLVNNKSQSKQIKSPNQTNKPNQSHMKDLKSTLSLSRDSDMVKNSRGKRMIASKSPPLIQKTQSKISQYRQQKLVKSTLSPRQSEITMKLGANPTKLTEQTRQYIEGLKQQINHLKMKVKDENCYQNPSKIDHPGYEQEINNLTTEKLCLIQILKLQEEKSSAAINYIQTNELIRLDLINRIQKDFLSIVQNMIQQNLPDQACAIRLQDLTAKSHITAPYTKQKNIQPVQKAQNISSVQEAQAEQIQKLKLQLQSRYRSQYEKLISTSQQTQNKLKAEFQIERNSLTRKCSEMQSQIKQMLQQSQRSQIEIKSTSILNHSLSHKIKDLEVQIAHHKQQNESLVEKGQLLKIAINDLELEIERLKDIQIRYDILQKRQEQAISKIKRLEDELQRLSCQNQNPSKKMNKSPTSLTFKQKEISSAGNEQSQSSTILVMRSKLQTQDKRELNSMLNQINQLNTPRITDSDLLLSSRRVFSPQQAQQKDDIFVYEGCSSSLLNQDINAVGVASGDSVRNTEPEPQQTTYGKSEETNSGGSGKGADNNDEPQIHKYNYNYDVDNVNYFNNFDEYHGIVSDNSIDTIDGRVQEI